jgi:hypothetical protein
VSMKIDLYDTDFYAWTQEQAALLRDQQAQALDYANLVSSAIITQRVALVAARRISRAVSFSCTSIVSVSDDN